MNNEMQQEQPIKQETNTVIQPELVTVSHQPKAENKTKFWAFTLLSAALVIVLSALLVIPMNWGYVIETPGPTINVLAPETTDYPEIIKIKGAKIYSASGQLRMVTVNLIGGPERGVSLGQLLLAKLSGEQNIVPEETIFPKGINRQQINQISMVQMRNSQKFAEAAAAAELGHKISAQVKVGGINEGSDAKGKLKVGDILTELILPDRAVKLDRPETLFETMASTPAKTPIKVVFQRAGRPQSVEIVSTARSDKKPGSLLGIFVSIDPKLPFKIKFALENIGGPSAGLVFALGIIDKLTPGDLTGGKNIAATGEIDYHGKVGAIGGVQQKIYGAKNDGAQWFLLPKDNCKDIIDFEVLPTVPVEDLHQAREVVAKIASGNTTDLPKCPANK